MKTYNLPVNGIHLTIHESGAVENPAVILLHGFPEFSFGWHRQISFLAANGYRVIVPDQRGYYTSAKPRGRWSYHIQRLTDDIIGIMDKLQLQKVYLVGHDWGGMVAWFLAAAYPEHFIKLVNLNIPHPQVMLQTLKSDKRQRKMSWYIFFFQLPILPELWLRKDNFRNLVRALQKTSRHGTFSESDLNQYREAWQQPRALTGMINWYRAAYSIMFSKFRHTEITVPTLLIWGRKDRALSDVMAEPSIAKCTSGHLQFIDDASHWVQHEAAEDINRHIIEFFSANS
jgi:pimeloyl-ACP methyl ester carboxylesterase